MMNNNNNNNNNNKERILQFGEGNFLRAFADWMIQEINNRTDFNGKVVIIKPRDGNTDKFDRQQCKYHLLTQGVDNSGIVDNITLIESVNRIINPYSDFDAFMLTADNPDISVVISNTTEAGISFDPSCSLTDKPAVSFPAKLTQWLYRRFSTFNGTKGSGVIILPCELIQNNGPKLYECINRYIALWKLPDNFSKWFNAECAIYSTLVDRIVPGHPAENIADIDDPLLVKAELFYLWVIEADTSIYKTIPFDKAGLNVKCVPSITPYFDRKVTILNAAHTALSPVAMLSGLNIVRNACEDKLVGNYIRHLINDDLIHSLPYDLAEMQSFADDVLFRFINPFIDHDVRSIMLNAVPKFASRDLPVIKRYLNKHNVLPRFVVLGFAALIVYYKGDITFNGEPVLPNDSKEIVARITQFWAENDVTKLVYQLLAMTDVWGENLNNIPGMTEMLISDITDILTNGISATLENVI
jgi:tagaturonate reductase